MWRILVVALLVTGCASMRADVWVLQPGEAIQCDQVGSVSGGSSGDLIPAMREAQDQTVARGGNAMVVLQDSGQPVQSKGLIRRLLQSRTIVAAAYRCPSDGIHGPRPTVKS